MNQIERQLAGYKVLSGSAEGLQLLRCEKSGQQFYRRVFSAQCTTRELQELMNTRQRTRHPNLVQIRDFQVYQKEDFPLCDVVFETWSMSFAQEIENRMQTKEHFWTSVELKNTIIECMEAMRLLHEQNYFFGTITPQQIVCDDCGNLKILDLFCVADLIALRGSELLQIKTKNFGSFFSPLNLKQLAAPLGWFNDLYSLGLTILEASTLVPSQPIFDTRHQIFYYSLLEKRMGIVEKMYEPDLLRQLRKIFELNYLLDDIRTIPTVYAFLLSPDPLPTHHQLPPQPADLPLQQQNPVTTQQPAQQ